MGQCRCFRLYLIVGKHHGVITGRCLLWSFVIPGTISTIRILQRTRKGMQFADCRYHQQISQIAIPANPTHLRKGKPLDRGMLITITWSVVTTGYRIGTDLNHTKRSRCPRKCLTHTMIGVGSLHTSRRPNKRINVWGERKLSRPVSRNPIRRNHLQKKNTQAKYFFHYNITNRSSKLFSHFKYIQRIPCKIIILWLQH